MKTNRLKFFTNALLDISLSEDGLLDDSRILAVIQSLKEVYSGCQLKKNLIYYFQALNKYSARSCLTVEYCGAIHESTIENLKSYFETQYGRRFNIILRERKDLIAGIRVFMEDTVFEYSIARTLDIYKKSITTF